MIDTPGNPAQIERSSINDFNDTQSMTLRMLMILCFFFLWTTFAHLVNISSLYYHLGRWVTLECETYNKWSFLVVSDGFGFFWSTSGIFLSSSGITQSISYLFFCT